MLAVIGSAGRKEDAIHVSRPLYNAMYWHLLKTLVDLGPIAVVSGGAAFADHLAVRAFLEGHCTGLRLHLPAEFRNGRFVEGGGGRFDPGRIANWYHRNFSTACGLDSFSEIEDAIRKGAHVTVGRSFHERNTTVANDASAMIAFTFGEDESPIILGPESEGFLDHRAAGLCDGGTADTWAKAKDCSQKRHVSLTWLRNNLTTEPTFRVSAGKLQPKPAEVQQLGFDL